MIGFGTFCIVSSIVASFVTMPNGNENEGSPTAENATMLVGLGGVALMTAGCLLGAYRHYCNRPPIANSNVQENMGEQQEYLRLDDAAGVRIVITPGSKNKEQAKTNSGRCTIL